jgi:hypothetical protein
MKKFSNLTNEGLVNKQKLGLDFHGVIDAMPEFFAFLSDSFVKNGGEVHVITGGHWDEEFENQLKSYGVKWTHKFSIYDHLIESDAKIVGEIEFPDGTIQKKFENGQWDHVKSNYCSDNNISLHIDDKLIYNEFFTTPFARLWSHNNKPKASHTDKRHLD